MTNYKTAWKTLAKNKAIKNYHVVQYCIAKTMCAKGENKDEILHGLLKRAFSPKADGTYPTLRHIVDAAWLKGRVSKRKLFDMIELTDEELTTYSRLLDSIITKKLADANHYSYIFVRQDLEKECQLVQAAHVTCVLGQHTKYDATKLYFVVVGVENLEALDDMSKYLGKKGHEFVDFIEPDIGNERTAIATLPVKGNMRKDFKKFKLLKL